MQRAFLRVVQACKMRSMRCRLSNRLFASNRARLPCFLDSSASITVSAEAVNSHTFGKFQVGCWDRKEQLCLVEQRGDSRYCLETGRHRIPVNPEKSRRETLLAANR
jgi:hypothetical protein